MVAAPHAQQVLVRKAARALAKSGLVTAYGHCSLRLDAHHLLVCAAKPMGSIEPGEDGTVCHITEPRPPGVLGEVRIHQQLYRARADVGAVCRIAPPKLFSVAALGRSPRVRHGFGTYFAPAAPYWADTRLLRNDDLAAALVAQMGDARGIVLRGNGAITVGETLSQAVTLAYYLEDAARVELDVLATGVECAEYTPDEARQRSTFEAGIVDRMWDHLTTADSEQ